MKLSSAFLLCGLGFFAPSVFAADIPARVDISYSITSGGLEGEVNDTLEIKHKSGSRSYAISSASRAKGLHVAATPGDEDNKGFHYFSRGTRMTLPITQRSFVLHLRGALVLFRCATRSHLQISISSLQHQQVLALLSAPCRHRN